MSDVPTTPNHELFKFAVVVRDLDAAMAELTASTGIQWRQIGSRTVRCWNEVSGVTDVPFRVVHSLGGPPYLELVQHVDDTIWTATDDGTAHFVGFFADDLPRVAAALEAAGATRVASDLDEHDEPHFFVCHRTAAGPVIEHVNADLRDVIIG